MPDAMLSASDTSKYSGNAPSPSSDASSRANSSRTSAITGNAPSRASIRQIAAPRPRAPPVTTATLPSSDANYGPPSLADKAQSRFMPFLPGERLLVEHLQVA